MARVLISLKSRYGGPNGKMQYSRSMLLRTLLEAARIIVAQDKT
jgi:hypothetical protein